MPNGTGKTTSLDLLRATLSGGARSWYKEKIMQYESKNGTNDKGSFKVNLLINSKRVTISLIFDFEIGAVSYFTTTDTGNKEGFIPPRNCKDILSSEFINFLVFDGELAQQLLYCIPMQVKLSSTYIKLNISRI